MIILLSVILIIMRTRILGMVLGSRNKNVNMNRTTEVIRNKDRDGNNDSNNFIVTAIAIVVHV